MKRLTHLLPLALVPHNVGPCRRCGQPHSNYIDVLQADEAERARIRGDWPTAGRDHGPKDWPLP